MRPPPPHTGWEATRKKCDADHQGFTVLALNGSGNQYQMINNSKTLQPGSSAQNRGWELWLYLGALSK